MIVNNIFLFQKFYTVKISIRNYTELSVVKYFPEKNDPTISKQLKNILLKFPISKTFRGIRIKLKVVNIKLTMGKFPLYNIQLWRYPHLLQPPAVMTCIAQLFAIAVKPHRIQQYLRLGDLQDLGRKNTLHTHLYVCIYVYRNRYRYGDRYRYRYRYGI